jgi:hypothetical protein
MWLEAGILESGEWHETDRGTPQGAGRRQLARQTLALRLVLDDKPAVTGPPAVVGESEEGKGLRVTLATLASSHGRSPADDGHLGRNIAVDG